MHPRLTLASERTGSREDERRGRALIYFFGFYRSRLAFIYLIIYFIILKVSIMKLSEIKEILPALENVEFQLENGTFVPEHFHVTEVGQIIKNFIDCGGVIRKEKAV